MIELSRYGRRTLPLWYQRRMGWTFQVQHLFDRLR